MQSEGRSTVGSGTSDVTHLRSSWQRKRCPTIGPKTEAPDSGFDPTPQPMNRRSCTRLLCFLLLQVVTGPVLPPAHDLRKKLQAEHPDLHDFLRHYAEKSKLLCAHLTVWERGDSCAGRGHGPPGPLNDGKLLPLLGQGWFGDRWQEAACCKRRLRS